MQQPQERLWLVDEHDEPIGEGWQLRSNAPKVNWKNFRTVMGFLRNSKGQLWIPVRAAHKPLFPNALDASVSGHVTYGESYEDAFLREIAEELGLIVDLSEARFCGKFEPFTHNLPSWMKVWEIPCDDTPAFNPEDIAEGNWLFPEEIHQQLRAPSRPLKPDFATVVDLVYPLAA